MLIVTWRLKVTELKELVCLVGRDDADPVAIVICVITLIDEAQRTSELTDEVTEPEKLVRVSFSVGVHVGARGLVLARWSRAFENRITSTIGGYMVRYRLRGTVDDCQSLGRETRGNCDRIFFKVRVISMEGMIGVTVSARALVVIVRTHVFRSRALVVEVRNVLDHVCANLWS